MVQPARMRTEPEDQTHTDPRPERVGGRIAAEPATGALEVGGNAAMARLMARSDGDVPPGLTIADLQPGGNGAVARRIARSAGTESPSGEGPGPAVGTSAEGTAGPAAHVRGVADTQPGRPPAAAQDEATQALVGMDAVYDMYSSWQTNMLIGPPSWIYEWEALPVARLPADREGERNQLYLRLRRALAPHGYENLAAFVAAEERFVTAFREHAYQVALDVLQQYEQLLIAERGRYGKEGTGALHAALGPARATFQGADEYAAAALSQFGGSVASGEEYRKQTDHGNAQVSAVSGTDPLLGNQDFPREELARADEPGTSSVMSRYIESALEHIGDTRSRLGADHELIFRLDLLVAQAKQRQGIAAGSIWERIIADHQLPTMDDAWLTVMTVVLGVALGLLSGGSAIAAIASLGLSSYLAVQQYEDYAMQSDAHGSQLLSEEPELGWVVLAIMGAGVELAGIAPAIRGILPALQQFQRTHDIAELEAQLVGVQARIRTAILDRAALEASAAQRWEGLVPRGALRGSAFGLDFAAEAIGKLVYAVQLNLRRGVNTFDRWVLTREAVDLIGQADQLSPAQRAQLLTMYQKAVDDAQRIATHARTIGMSPEQTDALILAWAQRGSGTADDVLREITAAVQQGGAVGGAGAAPPGREHADSFRPTGADPAPSSQPAAEPQFGLDGARTRKLLDAVTPQQARILHDFLGDTALTKLADGQIGRIRSFAEAIERAQAAAADPLAAAGLARMGLPQAPSPAMSPSKIADILSVVPPGRMEIFLRALADPDVPHPRQLGAQRLKRLADSDDQLLFIGEFGGKAYDELCREDVFGALLEKLPALEPEQARAMVDAVLAAQGKDAKLRALGIEPEVRPRPRHATGKVTPDKTHPLWMENLNEAREFAKNHRGQPDRRGIPYEPDEGQIELLATMLQVRRNAWQHRGLPYDKRVQMLDEFDQLGREAELQTWWINNLRGSMSEFLFSPTAGRDKTRLLHPNGDVTIPDYAFEAGQRPGSKTGRKEWVEQKSDLITAPNGSTAVFRPAVDRAKRYALKAELTMQAIDADPAHQGETILIEFVRRPGNDATQTAMLAKLFGPSSPIAAVKFGDDAWIERANFPATP